MIVATFFSIVGTFIVPRDVPAIIASNVSRVFTPPFRLIARLPRSYEAKDRILAFQAPLFLVALLGTWLGLLLADVLAGVLFILFLALGWDIEPPQKSVEKAPCSPG